MALVPVRLALIGAGRWGRNYIRTIGSLAEAELTAVVSRNPETASLVPAGCAIVQGWWQVIRAPDIDGVIVATPAETHAEILLAAIDVNKPVLVEKPVVHSRDEAARVRAKLSNTEADILVDNVHLFHPAFRRLHRLAGSLGPIKSIKASAGNRGPYRAETSVLWDWGPHDLAMCLTLVPGPISIESARRVRSEAAGGGRGEELELELLLGVGSVTRASLRLSTLADQHRWFAVEFAEQTLVYRDRGPNGLVSLLPGAPLEEGGTPIDTATEQPLTRAVLDFCTLIFARSGDRASIDLSLAVVDALSDIEQRLTPRETNNPG